MNGPLAQIIALTCHGNAFLRKKGKTKFFPANTACMFCDAITFVLLKKNMRKEVEEKEIAATPDAWFVYLKENKVQSLRLVYTSQNDPNISDRMSAGFVGGGGDWAIEAVLVSGKTEYWEARWEVWNRNAPEQKIWRVTYGMVGVGENASSDTSDLQSLVPQLEKSLKEIHIFASKHNIENFTQCFANALLALKPDANVKIYHNDLTPDSTMPAQAVAVLNACQSAWVFGGMGSWNDMGFDGDEQLEYDRVSEQLFQTINRSIIAAVNTSAG